jgi:AsmA protein
VVTETLNDSLANASGYFDFSVQNGVIQGVNLNHELCDAFNRLKNYPRPPANQEQFTEFVLLRGKSRVNDGIASTNDLLATTPNLKISAQGRMDLSSKNLNYDVDAEMTEVISIPQCNTLDNAVGYSIPLKLSGTTTKPIILPDFGQLLLQEAQEVIRDVLLERLLGN